MTNLTAAAQAVLDASNLHPCGDSRQILAAALRAAAEHLGYQLRIDVVDLLAIADELEGVKYGTYRCNISDRK
jgi:hypothetical protein